MKSSSNTDIQNNEQSDEKVFVVAVNRVTKVTKGGRNFSFAVIVVWGDGNGKVGWGSGKAKEVVKAKNKAIQTAKKSVKRFKLKEGRTIHHDINGRFGSGKVFLRSAQAGTGVIAGGPMRSVFEALGIYDIVSKSLGSSNPYNMIRATFDALEKSYTPKDIAAKRSMGISEIIERRDRNKASKVENHV